MTYEIFNKETSWNKRGKPPVVRISQSGHIRFSVEAVKVLGIAKDTPISFLIDKRDDDVIYFFIDKDKGMPLVDCTFAQSGTGLQICCRPLSFRLLDFLGQKKNVTFGVTKDTCDVFEKKMWFLRKDRIHKPIKWKRQESKIIVG